MQSFPPLPTLSPSRAVVPVRPQSNDEPTFHHQRVTLVTKLSKWLSPPSFMFFGRCIAFLILVTKSVKHHSAPGHFSYSLSRGTMPRPRNRAKSPSGSEDGLGNRRMLGLD